MRNSIRKWLLLACGCTAMNVASLLFAPAAGLFAAQAPSSWHSGMYGDLMLAVAPSGEISGYYSETLGQGVTRTCSFFLSGQATSDQVSVKTWEVESFPGMLKSEDNRVTLKIERGSEHPGCGSVLPPEISQGIALDLDFAANWIALRRVASRRAYFFQGPTAQQRLNAYLVKDDIVAVISESADWLQVEYIRDGSGKRIKGWIRSSDCESLAAL